MNSDNYGLKDFMSLGGKDVFGKAYTFAQYLLDMRKKDFDTYSVAMNTSSSNRVNMAARGTQVQRDMIMLGSNNYLGLTTHPRVLAACHAALDKYGSASGGPSLLAGTYDIHKTLEARIAAFKGTEDAILFPSGYAANVGTIGALVGPGQAAVLDQCCHASIIDGATLSQGDTLFFRHNNADHLDDVLRKSKSKYESALVVVDGVYSTTGTLADLPELVRVCRAHNARLLVDDAHATGVVGPTGRGTAEVFGLENEVDMVVGTLNKALAGMGGFAAGPRKVIDYIRFYGRSQFFSTMIPPVSAAGILEAIEIVDDEPERLKRLWKNTTFLRDGLTSLGFDLGDTQSPILPVMVGPEIIMRRFNRDLYSKGVYASAIPYPAVPKNKARIRLSVNANLTENDLQSTLEAMECIGKKLELIPERIQDPSLNSTSR